MDVAAALRTGLPREQVAEAIRPTALHGGPPAATDGPNAALEAFAEEDATEPASTSERPSLG